MHHREAANLHAVLRQITALLATEPSERPLVRQEEAEDPACIPKFWISKWVDYSSRFGLGYQLCDNSVGVLFNDYTRLMMYADGDSLQYIDNKGAKSFVTVRSYPDVLTKKIFLLKYFRSYMSAHLDETGANMAPQERDVLVRLPWQLPYLAHWFRSKRAIGLYLSNGAVQINFFRDHTKLIFCPLTATVTYIDNGQVFRTYRLPLLEECGCSRWLVRRIRYAKHLVKKLLRNRRR